MDNDLLLYYLVGALIALVITYYLIAGAVKAGNKQVVEELQLQNRLLAKQLVKDGVPAQDILNIKGDQEEYFWPKLRTWIKNHPNIYRKSKR